MVLTRFYLQHLYVAQDTSGAKQIEASIFSLSLPKKCARSVLLGCQCGFGGPINMKHGVSLLLVFIHY